MSNSRNESALKYFKGNESFFKTTAKANIEQYRKGKVTVRVADKAGNAVPNASLQYTLKNHAFKFGANLFMLDEMETSEKNEFYKDAFKNLFNLATLPFYWDALEPERNKPRYDKNSPKIYRRPAPDLCVAFCKENGIEPKLHCLTYDNFIPNWLLKEPLSEIKKAYTKRFREIAERYADTIPSMEVTNELLCPSNIARSDLFFADDNAQWCYHTADAIFPYTKLIINEACPWEMLYPTSNRNAYYMQIENLLAKNCRIDSVGFQFHSFGLEENEHLLAEKRYNPEFVYAFLDKFAQLNRPLQITEMTIPAYRDTKEDTEIQAELLKYIYTMFFSHPAMEAIIYWNLPDGYAAFAPQGDMEAGENRYRGGILNYDLSKKPAYHMLHELIHKEWQTKGEVGTDAEGNATFTGFYGSYDVKLSLENGTSCNKMIDIRKDGTNIYTIVLDH